MGNVLLQTQVQSTGGQAGISFLHHEYYFRRFNPNCVFYCEAHRKRQGRLSPVRPRINFYQILLQTMVFTHLPSAVALALIPIPSSLSFAMSFLILRSCTQSMDVAPRSAFLAAAVHPNERTAVMGIINMVKTSSQSLGPLITGLLAGVDMFWVAFVMAGSLKATYDLGMLAVFAGHRTQEERLADQLEAEEGES
jgi:hypothetical protein